MAVIRCTVPGATWTRSPAVISQTRASSPRPISNRRRPSHNRIVSSLRLWYCRLSACPASMWQDLADVPIRLRPMQLVAPRLVDAYDVLAAHSASPGVVMSRCFTSRWMLSRRSSAGAAVRRWLPNDAGPRCIRSQSSGSSCPLARTAAAGSATVPSPCEELLRGVETADIALDLRVDSRSRRRCGTKWGLGRNRTSSSRSDSNGTPVLVAEADQRNHEPRGRPAPGKLREHRRSSCTVRSEVLMTRSAPRLIVSRRVRSSRMPSSTDRSGASGCGRRVSE